MQCNALRVEPAQQQARRAGVALAQASQRREALSSRRSPGGVGARVFERARAQALSTQRWRRRCRAGAAAGAGAVGPARAVESAGAVKSAQSSQQRRASAVSKQEAIEVK